VIALGAKKSELAFSREDRELLADVAQAGALTLEGRFGAGAPAAEETAAEERAQVCAGCGQVAPEQALRCPACGGALEPAPLPAVLLGKFRLEQRVGAGGMGVVYRAQDLGLGRRVALKTLPQVSPEAAVRLRREARAMASVLHPHLALIFGVEAWRGTPLLVLEYLDAGTLAGRLEHGRRLPPAETVALGIALAEALDAAHRAGILHRDVKPSNIGFTSAGVAKLMDFGVARIVSGALEPDYEPAPGELARPDDRRRTASGLVLGTPLYLSPEALRGETADATFDLWGLAVVLFEAVAGRHPFERASWAETMAAITRAAAPELRSLRADAPPALAEFFAGALALDRGRRPSSARELVQRLERARA
jgi:serine/threonine-protein kinase